MRRIHSEALETHLDQATFLASNGQIDALTRKAHHVEGYLTCLYDSDSIDMNYYLSIMNYINRLIEEALWIYDGRKGEEDTRSFRAPQDDNEKG